VAVLVLLPDVTLDARLNFFVAVLAYTSTKHPNPNLTEHHKLSITFPLLPNHVKLDSQSVFAFKGY
jgi:hypothetical protein